MIKEKGLLFPVIPFDFMPMSRKLRPSETLCQALDPALAPSLLRITDESAGHRGHGGYRGEGEESHLSVLIVAERFTGLSRLDRQRLVLGLLPPDFVGKDVHALSLSTWTPAEWAAKTS